MIHSLLLITLLFSAPLTLANQSQKEKVLASDIKELKKRYNLDAEEIGVSIKDFSPDSEDSIDYNNEIDFYPASTFKVLTAYYLLKTLGPEYKLKTELGYIGKIKEGNLNGDLVLRTSGDPYFQSPDLYNLLNSLLIKDIKTIKGDLIISSQIPPLKRMGYVGLDDQPYNQSISSFNLDFNRFKVLRRGKSFDYFPKNNELKLTSRDEPLGPGEIFRNIKDDQWQTAGLPKWYFEVPLRNSLKTNGAQVIQVLNELGIKLEGQLIFKEVSLQKSLAIHHSLNLKQLLILGLEYSNNLFMETLLLQATKKDSLLSAAQDMKKFFVQNFKSIDFKEVNFVNGSGLTLKTKVKPSLMASFLTSVRNEKFANKHFFTFLTLAGHGGFLAKKFLTDKNFQHFFAKTGSLDYVNGLCGISIKAKKSFCIFVNDFKKRETLIGPNTEEQHALREKAKVWKNVTDGFIEALITKIL